MATPQPPKFKFNDFLDQRMQDRSGGKEQWKSIKKVWEGLKLKWTQAGYLVGGTPNRIQLSTMEGELSEALQEAKDKEIEQSKLHVFKKEGTKQREKAEAELKIGTWAIEETRRAQLNKKTEMMGVVAGAEVESSMEATQGSDEIQPAPVAASPNPESCMYPKLPEEATQPPPYSLTTQAPSAPSIQAPVLRIDEGLLQGQVSMQLTGGYIDCGEVERTSTPCSLEGGLVPTPQGGRSLQECGERSRDSGESFKFSREPLMNTSLPQSSSHQTLSSRSLSPKHSLQFRQLPTSIRSPASRSVGTARSYLNKRTGDTTAYRRGQEDTYPEIDVQREYIWTSNEPEEEEEEEPERATREDVWAAAQQLDAEARQETGRGGPFQLSGVYLGDVVDLHGQIPSEPVLRRSRRLQDKNQPRGEQGLQMPLRLSGTGKKRRIRAMEVAGSHCSDGTTSKSPRRCISLATTVADPHIRIPDGTGRHESAVGKSHRSHHHECIDKYRWSGVQARCHSAGGVSHSTMGRTQKGLPHREEFCGTLIFHHACRRTGSRISGQG
ncbi:uncharacterized protein LOC116375798 [Oncorhynchus kisutch]|uniref:uncharacterized protein LOC116375798 n=1 Tax=Oncorhynchus kisutch TaxID=8019 RepID=UPI0012DD291F|nr:uncharacterized protein LOC116375798 [Oncorhynchus kisutch]